MIDCARVQTRSRSLPLLWPGWVLMVLIQAGCVVGDPYTESRIVNATDSPVMIRIGLDQTRYGVDEAEPAGRFAGEWFREFAVGEGVEELTTDHVNLVATYRLAPGGYFVAHGSLGRRPYIAFKYLGLSQGSRELSFRGYSDIEKQFLLVNDESYLYTFTLTDSMFE